MSHLKSHALVLVLAALVGSAGATQSRADDAATPICPLVLHEEQLELEEAVLQVELNRSSFAAFEEINLLISRLYEEEAADRMTYLRARYDRDAAKLGLERADLILKRQKALIEQLRLACAVDSDSKDEQRERDLKNAYLLYRRTDCEQQEIAIEVAETNLTFNRQWLESILDLRGQVSTAQDVIRARLDVKLEEQRRDDATRRTSVCRAELKELEEGSASAD